MYNMIFNHVNYKTIEHYFQLNTGKHNSSMILSYKEEFHCNDVKHMLRYIILRDLINI